MWHVQVMMRCHPGYLQCLQQQPKQLCRRCALGQECPSRACRAPNICQKPQDVCAVWCTCTLVLRVNLWGGPIFFQKHLRLEWIAWKWMTSHETQSKNWLVEHYRIHISIANVWKALWTSQSNGMRKRLCDITIWPHLALEDCMHWGTDALGA